MVEHDRTQVATLAVRDGEVQVTPGRHTDAYDEWPVVDAARLLALGAFGGLQRLNLFEQGSALFLLGLSRVCGFLDAGQLL